MARTKFVATHIIIGNNKEYFEDNGLVLHHFKNGEFLQETDEMGASGNVVYRNKGGVRQVVSPEHVRPVYVPSGNLSVITV